MLPKRFITKDKPGWLFTAESKGHDAYNGKAVSRYPETFGLTYNGWAISYKGIDSFYNPVLRMRIKLKE